MSAIGLAMVPQGPESQQYFCRFLHTNHTCKHGLNECASPIKAEMAYFDQESETPAPLILLPQLSPDSFNCTHGGGLFSLH